MDTSQGYILLVGHRQGATQAMPSLSGTSWPVFIAQSAEQAVARMQQDAPYLVILSGNQQNWSQPAVKRLRDNAKPSNAIIVALTESNEPSWSPHEDYPELDGFLVKRVSSTDKNPACFFSISMASSIGNKSY